MRIFKYIFMYVKQLNFQPFVRLLKYTNNDNKNDEINVVFAERRRDKKIVYTLKV